MYGLLLAPDPGDSLDSKLALLAYNDLEAYKDMVKPSGEAVIKTRYQVPLSRPVIKTREDWFLDLGAGTFLSLLYARSYFPCLSKLCFTFLLIDLRSYPIARRLCHLLIKIEER